MQGCDLTVSLASQAGQLELNVMMPIIAHNLFEMMQVMIGSISAFTQKCVLGLQANRIKAEGWLARNAIVATALNPLIGYSASASLVKEALKRNITIREVALEKVAVGELRHIKEDRLITTAEIDLALKDLQHLTYGGIVGQ
jgi:fumarate hydratase class II